MSVGKTLLITGGVLLGGALIFRIMQEIRASESGENMNGQGTAIPDNAPRGIRNKNPLNIEYNKSNAWQGQTGSDGRFAQFSHSKYGIRAGAKLINTYMTKYGLTTVAGIVGRWAPSAEAGNHTQNYAEYVAKKVGVGLNDQVAKNQIPAMVNAMIDFENGTNPYTAQHIIDSCALGGVYGTI